MAKNKNQNAAQKAKEDEFYTQLPDIANELSHYRKHFRDKIVLCNCDDPYESNFFKFFATKFNARGLKKLICTCYDGSPVAGTEFDLFEKRPESSRKAFKIELTEVTDVNGDGATDLEDVEIILRNNPPTLLEGNGDFRSPECIQLLQEADIVVTNPPFSLFREFVNLLYKYEKKFLIIGNQNNVTYKDIFSRIRDNELWLGYYAGSMKFVIPEIYDESKTNIKTLDDGTIISTMGNICWFTNLDHSKRHEEIDLYKHYTPKEYPKYDNYDAIIVKNVADIPADYNEPMGVPPTFFANYDPDQFVVLGITDRDNNSGLKTKVYTKEDAKNASDLNRRGVLKIGTTYKLCWPAILIKKRK